jgi:S1-C subfamily serine protease/regulator of sirC expression with transglutaminase-like and TPR domain
MRFCNIGGGLAVSLVLWTIIGKAAYGPAGDEAGNGSSGADRVAPALAAADGNSKGQSPDKTDPQRQSNEGPAKAADAAAGEATPGRGESGPSPAPIDVEKLVQAARKAVVVVTFLGRDGRQQGLGTGFVIAADGLIATNLHVIGEARPIQVQLADGRTFDATSIYASDRKLDLALVRIDAKDLPALELGDSSALQQGQTVVALGNPHGLRHSVVSGVVSGRREIDGKPMIQLAMPIEPGNSGGPVLDKDGRVQGVLTMKSLVTENLGFAVEINALRPLLERPNPVAIDRWLTIGALDPKEWTPHLGSRWRQRAGKILVDGLGSGFGGRSYCVSSAEVPDMPYELAVSVKLDHESGAAGLIVAAKDDLHYGFYPTGGQLRLTRFEGPDVSRWTILQTVSSKHYRPGEWNDIKVRVEKERLVCYVNDAPVIEARDDTWREGNVGLVKFRDTNAEFKHFRLGKELPPSQPSAEVRQRVAKLTAELVPDAPADHLVEALLPEGSAGVRTLQDRAAQLERQAVQLRQLARDVDAQQVTELLAKALRAPEDQIDLLHAALLIARLDNPDVDVEAYRRQVDRLASEVRQALPENAGEATRLAALHERFFSQWGFHGSRVDYDNRANSYLNEVLDDREGLPITLSVLYMELARRLQLKVVGVGLPGHFMVRYEPAEGEPQLIDVFDGGAKLTRQEAQQKIAGIRAIELRDEHFFAASRQSIVVRMLHNLLANAEQSRDAERMLRYFHALVQISPDAAEERWYRAVLRYQSNRLEGAAADVEWLLERQPRAIDLEPVQQLRQAIEEARRRQ